MIDELEWTRLQLEQLKKRIVASKGDDSLLASVADLRKKAEDVEAVLLQPTIGEEDQKSFRGPLGLYLKFVWLNSEAATGAADVSGNADLGPTQPERDVFEMLDRRLDETKKKFRSLYDDSVPAFNKAMEAKGLAVVSPVKEVLPEFGKEKEKKDEE